MKILHTLLKRPPQEKKFFVLQFLIHIPLSRDRRQFALQRETVASLIVGNVLVRQIKTVLKTVLNSGQLHQLKSLLTPYEYAVS